MDKGDEVKSEPQMEMPFYLMRPMPVEEAVNGSTNLILYNDLQQAFNKYCCKKVKEPLNAFLQKFPGSVNTATIAVEDDESKESSSLNSLFNSRIITKEIQPLTSGQYGPFRLYPGSLPSEYKEMIQSLTSSSTNEAATGGGNSSGGSSKKPKKSKKSADGDSHEKEKRKKKKEKKKKKKSSGKD